MSPAVCGRPKVAVLGSLNIDLLASVERLPSPGETVPATALLRRFGGKGANQAVAAARQGAAVTMIGCVGNDPDGIAYRRHLQAEHIRVTGILADRNAPTGLAMIAVDRQGENVIVVVSGANAKLSSAMVRAQRNEIASAQVLLVQFEVPLPAVVEGLRIANKAGVPVLLNPSPLRKGFPWGKCKVDSLLVNSLEARSLFGPAGLTGPAAQRRLEKWQIENLIITRGSHSTICLDSRGHFDVPTLPVKPVDTVGAGDAFAGTYAAARAEGLELPAALRLANCAGALATLKPGAQEAIPTRARTRKTLNRLPKH